MREVLAHGYDLRAFKSDVLAGLVVGVVALPLSMALSIASGVSPQHGLYTAIVAGAIIALLGGSRVQVSGPTAAFVALLVPVSVRFGVGGLLLATAMAGVMLIVMGATRMGRLVEFVPYPVTMGFTAGVAVVIATLQLRDFMGLTVERTPDHFLERVKTLAAALPTARWSDLLIGFIALAILLLWPKLDRRIPAPLVALAAAGLAAYAFSWWMSDFQVATINSRFSFEADGVRHAGIPRQLPRPILPWRLGGPGGEPLEVSLSLIRAGARSPLSAVTHSVFVLLSVLILAPLLGFLPMAALAALLLVVAWNMGEWKQFGQLLRGAPRGDVTVLVACFGLTIVFDMVVSVTVGVLMAALLFMKRMAEVSGVTLIGETHPELEEPLPRGVMLYEVAGPLFFGAAQKAIAVLATVERRGVKAVVLDVRSVPALDATGIVSLELLFARLNRAGIKVILAGVQPQPFRALARAGWRNRKGRLRIFRSFEKGIERARSFSDDPGVAGRTEGRVHPWPSAHP